MKSKFPPSAIARRVAAHHWPDVQESRQLAKGVYEFSCAGHGGMVAVTDAANIRRDIVEVGRKHGLVSEYLIFQYRIIRSNAKRTKLVMASDYYTPESKEQYERWRDSPGTMAATVARGDVWIGEEDCGFATLLATSRTLHDRWAYECARARGEDLDWLQEYGSGEYVRRLCTEYYPEFTSDLDALNR